MKKYTYLSFLLLILATFQSCGVIEGIFKAGMWWAFILIALVIFLIFWLLKRTK